MSDFQELDTPYPEPDEYDLYLEGEPSYDPTSGFQTDMTVRDLAWSAALEIMQERMMFRQWWVRERAGLRDRHSRTVRRVLNCMVELGWLVRVEDKPNYFKPGPRAAEYLNIKAKV